MASAGIYFDVTVQLIAGVPTLTMAEWMAEPSQNQASLFRFS